MIEITPKPLGTNRRDAALAWEKGCTQDIVRNDYVVPALAAIIQRLEPQTVLDVGAGTGFIVRSIAGLLNYKPQWTLLDLDDERLKLAGELSPSSMEVTLVCSDIFSPELMLPRAYYDAILITFSLLEIVDIASVITVLKTYLSPVGCLSLVVPDPWQEVIDDALSMRKLLDRAVSISKVDKFTGDPYPYHVVRTEEIIRLFVASNFVLCGFERLEAGPPLYLLSFTLDGNAEQAGRS